MTFRHFFPMVVLLVWGSVSSAPAVEWEEVRQGSRAYVTLDSFARFYDLTVPQVPPDGFFELRGGQGEIMLRPASRECFINGRKAWLSFPLALDPKGRTLVPKADVIMLFDPLLRRGRAVPPRPFKGVVIDPGHGGADKGAQTRTGYTEKAAALDTSLRLQKLLTADGIPTVMTRKSDIFITLEDRAAVSARHPGYVFVSVHYNAGPRVTHGVETFALSPQGTPSTSSQGVLRPSDLDSHPGNRTNLHNILLTGLVHREMARMHTAAGDRGVKRARFVVLRENHLPSVLVEGGFMSNSTDAALIKTPEYREKVARAIHRGVLSYVREVDPLHPWVAAVDAAEAAAAAPPVSPPAPQAEPVVPVPPAPPVESPADGPVPEPVPVVPAEPPAPPAPSPSESVPEAPSAPEPAESGSSAAPEPAEPPAVHE